MPKETSAEIILSIDPETTGPEMNEGDELYYTFDCFLDYFDSALPDTTMRNRVGRAILSADYRNPPKEIKRLDSTGRARLFSYKQMNRILEKLNTSST